MSAPTVTGPHDVPNLRLYLRDRWRVGGVFEESARVMFALQHQASPYGWRPREESDWQRLHLSDPDLALWWVSEDMVDEISHVAAEMPDDVKPEDIPGLLFLADDRLVTTHGLVVLEKSILGFDTMRPDHQINVDAFMYGGTHLPPVHGRPWRDAVSVSTYRRVDYDAGLDEDQLGAASPVLVAQGIGTEELQRALDGDTDALTVSLRGEEWLPLGRSDWPFIDQLRDKIDRSVSDQAHRSLAEDRRWLAALHLVAEDHRVSTVDRVVPAKKELRRPSERAKLGTTVRVIYLRKLDDADTRAGRTATGRLSPRAHIVRSHARWQPYGPRQQLRRLILVPRHTRGHGTPEEGPPTVKAIVP